MNKTIKIYQVNLESGYAFMNYDYAKDLIEKEDYNLVAILHDGTEDDDYKLLDIIYNLGNNGQLAKAYQMRSISVSDIIEIDGTKYYVDSFGFKKI